MRRKISFWLCMLVTAVAVAGCEGKTSDNIEDNVNTTTAADESQETVESTESQSEGYESSTEQESESQTETSSEPEEPEEQKTQVIANNGNYFVKVDDKVYFREYGLNALENPVIFGYFLLNATGDHSTIDYYDEVSGETVQLCDDFGYGKIVYLDGKLFMNGEDLSGAYAMPYVYAIDLKGKEIKLPDRIYGTIKGVSESNDRMIVADTDFGSIQQSLKVVDGEGNITFEIRSDVILDYIDLVGEYLIYCENDYSIEKGHQACIRCSNIYSGDNVKIMDIEAQSFESFDFGKLILSEGEYYLPIVIKAGSGYMFQRGILVQMSFGIADSGREVSELWADEYDDSPMMMLGGRKRGFDEEDRDSYFVKRGSVEEDKDLMLKTAEGEEILIQPAFISGRDYYASRESILEAERVGDCGYIMLATMIYDEEGSIGWRDGFRLQRLQYLKMDDQGIYKVLRDVVYE